DEGWKAIKAANDPPHLFRHGSDVAVIEDEGDALAITHLTAAAFRGRLDRAANWVKEKNVYGKQVLAPTLPPDAVVEDMLALELPLPRLGGISGTPVFDRNGNLCLEPGYQEATGLYYQPAGEPIPAVPQEPDNTDL